ncbi:hypothetical protein DL767_004275 [Monosporascus sp. MG133]|nr:hypothetical protein DL767_004275 [Monosporascus sp. MG133]
MAEIYARASRVVVWLGEPTAGSDEALEEIRTAAIGKPTKPSINEQTKQAIQSLLQRQWFERIWVLQEVAAARNVLMKCGSTEIDGFVFCSGLQSLLLWSQSRARPVTYLIREAIFRPRRTAMPSGRFSLGIYSLGELIDMYHTHEATEHHDRVFALLGMASDDLSGSDILPNYDISWEQLFQRLVKFLLGRQVSVKTWAGLDMVVVRGKGRILGWVSTVKDTGLDSGPQVVITPKDAPACLGTEKECVLRASAKSVQAGDLVCLLEGASRPMIIRLFKDYFFVVLIAPPEDIRSEISPVFEFLLVWDWERSLKEMQGQEEYQAVIHGRVPKHLIGEPENYHDKFTRLWDVSLVLEDAKQPEMAEERLVEAIEGSERELGKEHLRTLKVKEKLALLYKSVKRLEEAERLLQQVIHMRKPGRERDPDNGKSGGTNREIVRSASNEAFTGPESERGPDHGRCGDSSSRKFVVRKSSDGTSTGLERKRGPDYGRCDDSSSRKLEVRRSSDEAFTGFERERGPDYGRCGDSSSRKLGVRKRSNGASTGFERERGPDHGRCGDSSSREWGIRRSSDEAFIGSERERDSDYGRCDDSSSNKSGVRK